MVHQGFGELSFRWIQICIGSPMHRSTLGLEMKYSQQTIEGYLRSYTCNQSFGATTVVTDRAHSKGDSTISEKAV